MPTKYCIAASNVCKFPPYVKSYTNASSISPTSSSHFNTLYEYVEVNGEVSAATWLLTQDEISFWMNFLLATICALAFPYPGR